MQAFMVIVGCGVEIMNPYFFPIEYFFIRYLISFYVQ